MKDILRKFIQKYRKLSFFIIWFPCFLFVFGLWIVFILYTEDYLNSLEGWINAEAIVFILIGTSSYGGYFLGSLIWAKILKSLGIDLEKWLQSDD